MGLQKRMKDNHPHHCVSAASFWPCYYLLPIIHAGLKIIEYPLECDVVYSGKNFPAFRMKCCLRFPRTWQVPSKQRGVMFQKTLFIVSTIRTTFLSHVCIKNYKSHSTYIFWAYVMALPYYQYAMTVKALEVTETVNYAQPWLRKADEWGSC